MELKSNKQNGKVIDLGESMSLIGRKRFLLLPEDNEFLKKAGVKGEPGSKESIVKLTKFMMKSEDALM